MVVRLPKGYDTAWQSQMSAAANLAVEAGRAAGQGWSDLGRGIGAGLAGFAGARQQQQARQDRLTQQNFENDVTRRQLEFTELRGRYGIMDDLYNSAASERDRAMELLAVNPNDATARSAFAAAETKVKQYEAARGALGSQVAAFQMQEQARGGCPNGRCGVPSYAPPPVQAPGGQTAPMKAPEAVEAPVAALDLSGYETSPASAADPRTAYEMAVADARMAASKASGAKSAAAKAAWQKKEYEATVRAAGLRSGAEESEARADAARKVELARQIREQEAARSAAEDEARLPDVNALAKELGWKGAPFTVKTIGSADNWIKGKMQENKELSVATGKDAIRDKNVAEDRAWREKMAETKQGYALARMDRAIAAKKAAAEVARASGQDRNPRFKELDILHDNAASKGRSMSNEAADMALMGKEDAAAALRAQAAAYFDEADKYAKEMAMLATPAATATTPASAPKAVWTEDDARKAFLDEAAGKPPEERAKILKKYKDLIGTPR